TPAERAGSFVNVAGRLQTFAQAFPAPAQVKTPVEVLTEILARFDAAWAGLTEAQVFDRLAARVPAFSGVRFEAVPATGRPVGAEPALAATVAGGGEP
ncbi:MAG TPA: hypothetical protein PK413_02070, partial [Thermoanaerobaculia bacterium]|nr:hypothetical protein [Thermoanaerobaculia bacterium]